MRSIKNVKGFKNDKRNLLDATSNLIVFGEGQKAEETIRFRRPVNRLCRRPDNRASLISYKRSVSRASQPFLVPGPGSAFKKLDQLDGETGSNYFLGTKPWKQKQLSLKASEEQQSKDAALVNESTSRSTQLPASKSLSQEHSNCREGLVCPVCAKGFEPDGASRHIPAADMMRYSMASYQQQSSNQFRKNLEDGWGALAKPKCAMKPQEVVVSANCGELFHKICLRDWCSMNHRISPRNHRPCISCPSCGKELKYTVCQDIETVRNFSSEPTALERDLTQTKLINKELQLLWPETSSYLAKLQGDIRDAETVHKEIKSRKRHAKSELKKLTAEDFSVVMSKVTDIGTMKVMLERQEKALEFMEQETLQIMRMYLLMVIRKTSDSPVEDANANPDPGVTSLGDKIPPELIPCIQGIMNDDHSLNILSRIIAPLPDEAGDADKRKLLELELLTKYYSRHINDNELTRTNTYTIFSSAVEVGDTASESLVTKEQLLRLKDPSNEEKLLTFLKAVTGMHQIPAETFSSNDGLILQPKPLSDRGLPIKKPSKLLEVEETNSGNECLKINSSAGLLKKSSNVPSKNGMDKGGNKVLDADEKDDKEALREYISPLLHFPLPSSFKPVKWLSNLEDSRKTSSLDVLAMSVTSREFEFGAHKENMDKDKIQQLLKDSAANLGIEIKKHSSAYRAKFPKASHQPIKPEAIPKPQPDEEVEDDNVSWTTCSGYEDEVTQPVSSVPPNPPPPTVLTRSSCELVFSAKERDEKRGRQTGRQINTCQGQVPVHSDWSQSTVPEQQVSIAIMYIVDDGEEDSGSEVGESEIFANTAPDDSPSTKELCRIHVDAEKSSKYSMIASQRSSMSLAPVIDVRKPNWEKSCPTPISDALEKYRPPCISSWQNGLRIDNKATPVISRKSYRSSDNQVNHRLQEANPNANLAHETRMFYENESLDNLTNGWRVPSK